MSPPAAFDPGAIFECLARHGVDHIVIGGLAGIAQGAGWPTYDADIVVETSEANLRRLLGALSELEAEYDTLHVPPIRAHERIVVTATGPQLFRTKHGRLDVLKEAGGETFQTLTVDAVDSEQFGLVLRCASLEALLRMKRAANRAKDRAGIARIEDVLRQRRESAFQRILEEGRRQTGAFAALEPLAALAVAADATAETCLAQGARWTLLRILANRRPADAIMLAKKITPITLVAMKCLVETANEERVGALGEAVDERNVEHAKTVLAEWLSGFHLPSEDADAAERLAARLVELFSSAR
jgi:hypothetical protein